MSAIRLAAIRKILALLIPIITVAVWAQFFNLSLQKISVHRFIMVVVVVPAVFASLYFAILLWRKSKPEPSVLAVAIWIYSLFFASAMWTHSFNTLTREITMTDFFLVFALLPILLASFYSARSVWRRSRPEIPIIAFAIWVYSFLFINMMEPISLTTLSSAAIVLSALVACFYIALLASRKKPRIAALITSITAFAIWVYFFYIGVTQSTVLKNPLDYFALPRQAGFLLVFILLPIMLVPLFTALRAWIRRPKIVALLTPIITLVIWILVAKFYEMTFAPDYSFFLITNTSHQLFMVSFLLFSVLPPILLFSFYSAIRVWRRKYQN